MNHEILFIVEGITREGKKLYYDAQDDNYYSGFKDLAGATIFNNQLYKLFYDDIILEAKISDVVNIVKRYVRIQLY